MQGRRQSARMVESQFEDAPIAVEVNKEEVMEESVVEGNYGRILDGGTASRTCGQSHHVSPGSQDVVQIHTGEDNL